MTPLTVGIIGKGDICDEYLSAAPGFPILRIVACADAKPVAAAGKAAQWRIAAIAVDDPLNHIQLYCSEGSMIIADPDQFRRDTQVSKNGGDWTILQQTHAYGHGIHRILGLSDMAHAIAENRPQRKGLDLALHVLEAIGMAAIRPYGRL